MGMYHGLVLQYQMKMTLALQCEVCKNYIDPDDKTEVLVKLFGARQYGVCIGCNQEVAGPPWDQGYKTRWGRIFRSCRTKVAKIERRDSHG